MSGEKFRVVLQFKKLIAIVLIYSILYILLDYKSKEQQKELRQAQEEMLDAKYRYLTISADWAKKTCASSLSRQLQEKESSVKESDIAPTKLK